MSGIVGVFSRNVLNDEQKQKVMGIQNDMLSRGNSNKGNWLNASEQVLLASNCLFFSQDYNQPFTFKNLTIICDGTLYNSNELIKELRNNGYHMDSSCDFEIILKSYCCWGDEAINKLQGDFAFALWDEQTKILRICRDRFGMKPIYYWCDKDEIFFSSSLPALVKNVKKDRTIDKKALLYYFTLQSVLPPPHTPFSGFKKIDRQCFMKIQINDNGLHYNICHYTPTTRIVTDFKLCYSFDRQLDYVMDLLKKSINRRLIEQEGEQIIWLSGGIDSSLITAICAEEFGFYPKTISVGFSSDNDKYNEFKYSRKVARKYHTEHTELLISEQDIQDNISNCLKYANEPMMSNDYIGHYILAKYSHEQGAKVALTGLGADEIWFGYSWHNTLFQNNWDKTKCLGYSFVERDFLECKKILSEEFFLEDYINKFVLADLNGDDRESGFKNAVLCNMNLIMPEDPIKRSDSSGMANMVEVRTPFLDADLVDFSFHMDDKDKMNNGISKYVLKKISEKYFSNSFIYRDKGYFTVPAIEKTRGRVKEFCEDVLLSHECLNRGIYRRSMIEELIKHEDVNITRLGGNLLWQLTCFEYWLQQFD